MFVRELERVNDTEDFLRVTTGAGGVVDDGADDFLGIDEEDGSDSQCHSLAVNVGGILIVDHVVQVGDLSGFVGDDGERKVGFGDIVDILDPFLVRVEGVGTQTNEFNTALGKFRLKLGECTELSSATIAQIGEGEKRQPDREIKGTEGRERVGFVPQ
jgi:hypothetical protein